MDETRAAILDALRDGPATVGAVADSQSLAPEDVEAHLTALRAEGVGVIAGPEGYELGPEPVFDGQGIARGLDAPYEVEFHDAIGSTNDRARELALDGSDPVVVVADEQTAGRGRRDREWTSPSGGIWLSILDRPDAPTAHAPVFTMAAAVAVARQARAVGAEATIKWPNDVQVDGAKVAGILTETRGESGRLSWLVAGIGVNANVDPSDLPADRPVTSLLSAVGPVDRCRFTGRILERFADGVRSPGAVLEDWRDLSSTLGRDVRVDTPSGTITGRAVDVAFPGALILATDEGRASVAAGECEHLRPVE